MERSFERDTSPEARRALVEGLRRMSPAQKLGRFVALQRSIEELARAGLRMRHPGANETELRMMLARMWLDDATHRAVVARVDGRA